MKTVTTLLVLTIILLTACSNIPESERGNIDYFAKDDSRVLEAKDQAQKNMDYFISSLENDSINREYRHSVKVRFVDDNGAEHIWAAVTNYENEIFYGTIDNDPIVVKNLKVNDTVSIKKEDVEDWLISNEKTGERHGDYLSKLKLI